MQITVCDAKYCKQYATTRITVEMLGQIPTIGRRRSVDCCDEHAEQFRIGKDEAIEPPSQWAAAS